jgi:DNA modification methylase
MKTQDITIEKRDISTLREWDKNPRNINKKDFERLKKQLTELGQYKPLLITQEGVVFGGNMRLKALRAMGVEKVYVSVIQIENEEEMLKYALSDNDRAGYYDDDMLANLMPNFQIDWADYAVDFRAPTTLDRFADLGTVAKEDEAPNVGTVAVSKFGEVYQLGRHRLSCGDSTKIEDIQRLMAGSVAQLVFTDPPYNVDYIKINTNRGENAKGKKWQYNPIEGDNLTDADFEKFLTDAFANTVIATEKSAAWYVWYAHQSAREFLKAFDNNALADRQTLIWVKQSLVIGHSDYQWRHEPCFYLKREDSGKVPYYGTRKENSVWEISRDPTATYVHPTQKPVALAAKAIKNSSKPKEIVLDPFGGSGTTLIAAEQLDRTCYMMELDPLYIDVIRKRYANFISEEEVADNWEEVTPRVDGKTE